eukprot:9000852-Pyramimonas_sp.AAC.1
MLSPERLARNSLGALMGQFGRNLEPSEACHGAPNGPKPPNGTEALQRAPTSSWGRTVAAPRCNHSHLSEGVELRGNRWRPREPLGQCRMVGYQKYGNRVVTIQNHN